MEEISQEKFSSNTLVTAAASSGCDDQFIGLATGEIDEGNVRLVDVVGFNRRGGIINTWPALWVPEARCSLSTFVDADCYLQHLEEARDASERALQEAQERHEELETMVKNVAKLTDALA